LIGLCVLMALLGCGLSQRSAALFISGLRTIFAKEQIAPLCGSEPRGARRPTGAYFCGSIEDGADHIDIDMARQHLARRYDQLRIAAEMVRLRGSAERLVRTEWARRRIAMIADALLQQGILSGSDIDALPGPAPKATWSL
jgi:hypothetical protein